MHTRGLFFPFRPRYECVLHWSSLLSCVQMRHLFVRGVRAAMTTHKSFIFIIILHFSPPLKMSNCFGMIWRRERKILPESLARVISKIEEEREMANTLYWSKCLEEMTGQFRISVKSFLIFSWLLGSLPWKAIRENILQFTTENRIAWKICAI